MSKILLIVEGAVSEPKYLKQFIKYHDEQMIKNGNKVSPIVVQSYGTLIYDLYKKISSQLTEDEFETIPILIEILKSKSLSYDEELEDYEQFSDIFLFFDLDAHYFYKREDRNQVLFDNINSMLSFFNESTEKGKLLLSYPMFEALKCFKDEFMTENEILLHLFNIYEVKKNSKTTFKKKSGALTSRGYSNPTFSTEKIEKLVQYFIHCSIYLVSNQTDISNSQVIFENQYKKFIKPFNQVVILSAFPHFIIDIFGVQQYYDKKIRKPIKRNLV
ncbi:hypothetical protein Q7W34_09150 [Streptococcus suis]|nr:hypothetical protein [Streptococcus suis]